MGTSIRTRRCVVKAYLNKKYCPGDVNGNGEVDVFDMALLQAVITKIMKGLLTMEEALRQYPQCDVNGDGDIDVFDMSIVKANYGNVYPDP